MNSCFMSCLFPYISYWVPDDVLFIRIIRKLVSYIRVSISRQEQSFQLHHYLTTAATPTVSGELHQQLLPQLFQVPLLSQLYCIMFYGISSWLPQLSQVISLNSCCSNCIR
jgi:hypothetical protein